MIQLLELKERIKQFYTKYERFITPAVKFLLAFVALMTINANVGFMSRLNSIFIVLVLSLICAFLPYGGITFVMMAVVLAHFTALSLEVAVTALALFIVAALLYYMFLPGDSVLLILTPLLFFLKVPYIVPVAAGLLCGTTSAIPLAFGVVIYYIMHFVKDSAGILADTGSLTMLQRYTQLINFLKDNDQMLLMIIAFVATMLVVYCIRRLSVDHSWEIAIITGLVVNIMLLLAGVFVLDIDTATFSIAAILAQSFLSGLLAFVLQFFFFSVDYSRTEYTQFEDDEYYYYVKAVPKNTVTAQDVQVKQINPKNARGQKEE